MNHDDRDIEFLLKKGKFVDRLLETLKLHFKKNPYPIEKSKLVGFHAEAKKYGGLSEIILELVSENVLELDVVETARGLKQTVVLVECKQKRNVK